MPTKPPAPSASAPVTRRVRTPKESSPPPDPDAPAPSPPAHETARREETDPDVLIARLLAAAEAHLVRAAEASLVAGPSRALEQAEKLVRVVAGLAKTRALTSPRDDGAEEAARQEAERAAILERIEHGLDAGRATRALQVEALEARGIDPREGWIWDKAAGVWVWDPGPALERARSGS